MTDTLVKQIDIAARTLRSARYTIALVGAGISVESGIRPFRGKGGLWTEKGEPPMDGYRRWMDDPASSWREMLERRAQDDDFSRSIREARPNAAHHAMAELERVGALQHTITQNIDDLHFQAGSVSVTEIHGNRTRVRCINCGARWPWDEFLALSASASQHAPSTEQVAVNGVMLRIPPECPQCAGIVKGDTVMFGEPIPREFLVECQRQAEMSDSCIIVGTSATVVPAAYFPEIVLNNGGSIIEINTEETPFTPYAAAILRGPAAELLPMLVARLFRPPTNEGTAMTADAVRADQGLVRFIVLCGPRTGSTLLTTALDSHPDIVCFNEVFNFTLPNIDYAVTGYDGWDTDALALRKDDHAAFMERYLFGDHPPSVRAVGFKFMYDHFWEFPGLIETLQAVSALRIIHLTRRNGLRAFLSYRLASASGSWKQSKPRPIHQRVLSTLAHPDRILPAISRRVSAPPSPAGVVIAPHECLEYIQTRLDQERHFDELFAGHLRLDLSYEDLVANRQGEFARVQDFVDVESQPLKEVLERQNPGTIRDLVSNYDELATALRQTPYAWMLDEP